MKRTSDPDVRLLQAIADPARLAILRRLSAEGPTCACDLTDCCKISQSTLSYHLKVLREAGWVAGERRGTWIWYSVRPDAVERFGAISGGIRAGTARPVTALGASTVTERELTVIQPAWRQW